MCLKVKISEMNCLKFSEKYIQFIEKDLDDQSYREMEIHFENCSVCQSQLQFIRNALNSLPGDKGLMPDTSYFFTERTLSRIITLQQEEVSVWRWIYNVLFRKVSIISFSFSAVIIGIVMGMFIHSNQSAGSLQSSVTEQTLEEVYLAGTSDEYLIQFIDNQYFVEDGNK